MLSRPYKLAKNFQNVAKMAKFAKSGHTESYHQNFKDNQLIATVQPFSMKPTLGQKSFIVLGPVSSLVCRTGLDPEGFMTLHKFKKIINKTIRKHPEATQNKLSDEYIKGKDSLTGISYSTSNRMESIFIYGPNQASFCLLCHFHNANQKYEQKFVFKLKKHRWFTWNSNLGPQDGR